MAEPPLFPIPKPEKPDLSRPINQASLSESLSEQDQLAEPWSPKWRGRYDWAMRFALRPLLFLIVVVLNIWWDVNIRDMIWQSGRASTGFHLENSVIIALATTSMANFLGLIIIIAKHLFPERKG